MTLLTIAMIVVLPALALWGLLVWRQRQDRGLANVMSAIPHALRPAAPDDVLEGPRLQRLQAWGLVATLATAVFIPMYWLPEKGRQEAFEHRFEEHSLERGMLIYGAPPDLEEDIDPAQFKAEEKAISLGLACSNCHGSPQDPEEEYSEEELARLADGGLATPPYRDPITGKLINYKAPPLNNVFTRWDEEVIRFTIERGRPGTPMPAWGVEYGGPATSMMVDDVIAWLKTLPGNQNPPPGVSSGCENPEESQYEQCGEEIFAARCAICHGPSGEGKMNKKKTAIPDLKDEEGNEVLAPTWYQGAALWDGNVKGLSKRDHEFTIRNGRRFAFMPQFAEAPVQGIPVPPYPLTDAQIQAVMAYERTL